MKVKEYIQLLKELPQDADVFIMEHSDWGDFADFAIEPYFGKELYDKRFVDGETKQEFVEGVIIR